MSNPNVKLYQSFSADDQIKVNYIYALATVYKEANHSPITPSEFDSLWDMSWIDIDIVLKRAKHNCGYKGVLINESI